MNRQPCIRSTEGSRVLYDVLSSKGTYYYTVELLGGIAISCECPHWKYKKACQHAEKAEAEEANFQQLQYCNNVNLVENERVLPPLNGNRAFSLLR
jgi:hypothetical protein